MTLVVVTILMFSRADAQVTTLYAEGADLSNVLSTAPTFNITAPGTYKVSGTLLAVPFGGDDLDDWHRVQIATGLQLTNVTYNNGGNISFTNSLSATFPYSSGTYWHRAHYNIFANGSNYDIIYTVVYAPFTIQPANSNACGGNGMFHVISPIATSYQWQVNSGSGWSNLANGGVYSGVTDDTLLITAPLLSMNTNQYRVYINGTDTSNAAQLFVSIPPTAYNVTGGGMYCPGDAAIAIGLSNSQTGINYQLYNGVTSVGSPVAGTGSAISLGTHTTPGTYTVVATNQNNCQTTMAGSAIITSSAPIVYNVTGGGYRCSSGAPIGLSGSQVGISYQLFINSLSGVVNIGAPLVGTGTALNFGNVDTNAYGLPYQVMATNTSTGCTLTMSGSASVQSGGTIPNPYTVVGGDTICPGGYAIIHINSGGQIGVSYQLYRNSVALGPQRNGNGSPNIYLSFTEHYQPGIYTVIGSNGQCTRTMDGNATIVLATFPTAFNVTGGGATCSSVIGLDSSSTGVNYRVYFNGAPVGTSVAGTGHAISLGTYHNNGTYTVVGTNTHGCQTTMTGSAIITPGVAPNVYNVTGGGYDCGSGAPVLLSGSQAGFSYDLLYYDWDIATYLDYNAPPVTGTGSALNLGNYPYDYWGSTYQVRATNPANGCISIMSGTATTLYTNYSAPVAYTVTGGGTVCPGGGVAIGINNKGESGVGYQLYRGSTPVGSSVSGGGSGNISFGTQSLAGTYTVIATRSVCQSTQNGNAVITDGVLPTKYNLTGGGSYCAGASGVAIGLANSQTGCNYQLHNGASAVGLPVAGTGSAISFGGQLAGTYKVVATSTSGCADTMNGTAAVTIKAVPNVNIIADQTICNGSILTIAAFSGTLGGTSFSWTNNNTSIGLAANGIGDIASFTAVNNTSVPVAATIIVTPTANGCTGINDTFTITVKPTPTVVATSSYQQCEGATMTVPNFSGAVTGTTFNWTNNNTVIGLSASGTGNISTFTTMNGTDTAHTGTIIVTPVANGCTGISDTFDITVDPLPHISVTADQVLCNGASMSAAFNSNILNTTYIWTNTTPSIGLAASGVGNITSFTATNSSTTAVVATVIVTPVANACPGTNDTFSITANPTPNVVATSDQTLCNGATTTALNFNGSVSGTTYGWINNTTLIGLAASGAGNIAPFVVTNTGVASVSSSIIVTPAANGCIGINDTFIINVNPTPNINATADIVLCNSTTTSSAFTGAVSGTTYGWTNNTPAIGLAASGTGSISTFTAGNTTSVPLIATIIATPSANGCNGVPDTFDITVNPSPNVATVSNQTVCNGAATTAVNFSGAVSGTAYTWSNNTTSINLAAAGTGNIISFSATNSSNTPVTATVTVMPSANGCTGGQGVFDITVNPTPTVDVVSSQSLCHGAMTNSVAYTGAVTGTVYNWTNNNANIGLATIGAGNIASFMANNTGAIPETATVAVTPVANNCTGSPGTFDITVNPIPDVAAVSDQTLCNDAATIGVNFNGNVTGTLYSWVNTNTAIGLTTAGTGNIASFNASNITAATISGTITVTPSANNCTGLSESFDINVNPTPKLNSTLTPSAICANTILDYTPTSATFNTVFSWVRVPVAGIIPSTSSGVHSISETLGNTTIAEIDAKYVYTLEANGCFNKDTVVVGVQPTPKIPSIETKSLGSVCRNTLFQNFSADHPQPAGVEYRWTANNAIVWSSGSDKRNSLINFINAGRVVVKLEANVTGFICKASDSFEVVVNGNSTSRIPTIVYYNKRFICLDNTVDGYQWGYEDAATLDSVVLFGENNQDYLNNSPDFNSRHYWVITKDGDCSQKTYYNMPTGVEGKVTGSVFYTELYPNPATDYVNVEVNGLQSGTLNVTLMDITGKTIKAAELVDKKAQVYVGDIAPGIYSVVYYHNRSRIGVAKLVKN